MLDVGTYILQVFAASEKTPLLPTPSVAHLDDVMHLPRMIASTKERFFPSREERCRHTSQFWRSGNMCCRQIEIEPEGYFFIMFGAEIAGM